MKHREARRESLKNPIRLVSNLDSPFVVLKDDDSYMKNLRERHEFIQSILFMKGINREAAFEMKLLKMARQLQRNLNNKNIRHKKELILEQVKKSFTNSTFLANLREQSKEIENGLLKVGIDHSQFREMAKFILTKEKNKYRSIIMEKERIFALTQI